MSRSAGSVRRRRFNIARSRIVRNGVGNDRRTRKFGVDLLPSEHHQNCSDARQWASSTSRSKDAVRWPSWGLLTRQAAEASWIAPPGLTVGTCGGPPSSHSGSQRLWSRVGSQAIARGRFLVSDGNDRLRPGTAWTVDLPVLPSKVRILPGPRRGTPWSGSERCS